MVERFKFKIGERVRVKGDLVVGQEYCMDDKSVSDTFSSRMRNNLGKEATIMGFKNGKYELDIDPLHSYTDSMLKKLVDYKAKADYESNDDVDNLLGHIVSMQSKQRKEVIKEAIDKALDNGDKEEFMRLSKILNEN